MFDFETYIIVCQSIVRKNAHYKLLLLLLIHFYYLLTRSKVFIIHHELQIYYNKQ